MKKTNLLLMLILSIVLLVTSCNSKENEPSTTSLNEQKNQVEETSHTMEKENSKENKTLSYEVYRDLYELIKKNLKVEGFKQIYNSDGKTLVAASRHLTFNKRDSMSLIGEDFKTTQDTIFFESKDKNTLVSINIAYTSNYIGNDMVFFMPSVNDDLINSDLKNLTDFMIISYKNLIIDIHQTSKTVADTDITINFANTVVDILLKNNDK